MVDCLVEGTLIAIFAGLVLSVARRQDSGTRFAVWFAALMAIGTLPFLGEAWWTRGQNIAAVALSRSAITLPGSWAMYVFGAWGVIAGCSLIRVGVGLWHLRVVRRSLVAIDPAGLDSRLRETLKHKRGARVVSLCVSEHVQVPTAIGLIKPAVVIPAWGMSELSAEELNQILLHELAHLRRWDDWTNLAQKIVKALFFFHPAVWWIERKVSLEREMACDDAVLAETASPRAYAECLAHLAEKTLIQRSIALAQAALGRIRHTSLRVAQILDVNRPARSRSAWKSAFSLVAGFAVVCVWGVSRAPRLITFSDSVPQSAAPPAIVALTCSVESGVSTVATTAEVRGSKAEVRPHPARVVQTAVKQANATTSNRSAQNLARVADIENSRRENMIHLTDFDSSVVSTEAVFVVVEGPEMGTPEQPVYQIRVWRLTVFHPAVEQVSKATPHKET